MRGIGGLLERFKKLTPPDDAVRSEFVNVVEDLTKFPLEKSSVSVRNGVVHCAADPALKSEIFMRKKEILSRLEAVFGPKAPKDIR